MKCSHVHVWEVISSEACAEAHSETASSGADKRAPDAAVLDSIMKSDAHVVDGRHSITL